jgi:PAS domain S-box-containing protein
MAEGIGKEQKKDIMKDIIRKLHEGLSLEEAKNRFEKEIGNVTSTEIAEIEQGLMNEGISPDEIKKFCNVHALLFQSALEKSMDKEESPAHPVYLMKQDNREIEKIIAALKEVAQNGQKYGLAQFKKKVSELLGRLKNLDIHYTWKEQILFPYLEKYAFYGPSKVMWGKDDEIRELLKQGLAGIETLKEEKEVKEYTAKTLNPLIEEVDGMIFKEEKILFPASMEKLNVQDWVEVLKETENVGYGFIQKPKETYQLIEELRRAVTEEPKAEEQTITLPSGSFKLEELLGVLHTLPVDITFIDKDDAVRYFSEGKERIFLRTKSIIGRKVQNCHPPKSVDVVEKILQSFKEGKRSSVDFWIFYQGKYVYIQYFAVRDRQGNYLGTLEVSQDIAGIKKIEGEKRLLDFN